jgi:hypothetical protein
MDRFFERKNVERYRTLARTEQDAERKLVLKLLAEENARLKQEIREQATRQLHRVALVKP